MINLYFNKDAIRKYLVTDVSKAFEKRDDMWLYNNFNANIIRYIDCAEVLPPKFVNHPVFGSSTPDIISRYSKTFILLNMRPNKVYQLSDIHSDFPEQLEKLGAEKDIHLLCDCCFPFSKDIKVVLPEFGVTLKGSDNLENAFKLYSRNPIKLRDLLCS